jgi:hypothetical protein
MTSPRVLRLAGLVALLAPVAFVVVLVFGGATVSTCLGGPGPMCPVPVVPPIRSHEAMWAYLIVLFVAWLTANLVVLFHLARFDRSQLKRLAAGIALLATTAAGAGFLHGLTQRLRYAVNDAITWGLAGLVLSCMLAVVWVGLRPGSRSTSQMSATRTQ